MSRNTPGAGRYPHVVKAVLETPWAITLPALAAIRDLIETRAAGERFTADEVQARIGAGPSRQDASTVDGVAIIPVYGVIAPRADVMTEMSGGTSIDRLRGLFRDAVESRDVKSIVLDVNSPGGMTDLVPEMAAEIRGARGRKPIVAVANTMAASAAYWLGSQADELVVTPSGNVGSVGVYAAHEDISGMQEKLGVKTTLISAGKFKTERSPFEPLSEDARAAIQAQVDEMYAMFTADVAKGRRATVDKVRGGFGEGRMLSAKQAVKEGMADTVATLEETVQRLAATNAPRQRMAAAANSPNGSTMTVTLSHADRQNAMNEMDEFSQQIAAASSRTFADQAFALHDDAQKLLERLTPLAEVKEGHLTKAKREPLAACSGALREVADALEGVLAATDPDKHSNQARAELAAFLVRNTIGATR